MIRRAAPVQTTGAAPGRADQWIRCTATATVAGLAAIAGALSYSHMRQLAEAHGQGGWHAHAFPLSVDGVEIVASLVLLASRCAGRRSGWLPWAALIIGTAASLAANVATAQPSAISRVTAGWPAVPGLQHHPHLSRIRLQLQAPSDQPDHPGRVMADPELRDDSLAGLADRHVVERLGPVHPHSKHPAPQQVNGRYGRWRRCAVLMDQSSRDDTLVGFRPPPVTPGDAVSSQSSKDKPPKRSPEVPDDKRR